MFSAIVFENKGISFNTKEEWFWLSDLNEKSFIDFNRLRTDIIMDLYSIGIKNMSLSEFVNIDNLNYPRINEIDEKIWHACAIILLNAWVRKVVDTQCSIMDMQIFSWTLAGCFDPFFGGYFNKKHQKAVKYIMGIINEEKKLDNKIEPEKIVKALMDFCKIGKKFRYREST